MIGSLIANYYETVAVILFGIGFTTLMLHRNLVKKVIGLNIADSSVFLFLASKGYIAGRQVPIVEQGVQDASLYVNPIPTGLILTGIVISVSVTAFSLSLIVALYKHYGTLNLDEMMRMAAKEKDGDREEL